MRTLVSKTYSYKGTGINGKKTNMAAKYTATIEVINKHDSLLVACLSKDSFRADNLPTLKTLVVGDLPTPSFPWGDDLPPPGDMTTTPNLPEVGDLPIP